MKITIVKIVQLEVAKGFRLPTVPEDAYENLRSHLNSYDVGVLIALDKMCLALKSMMLCLMVIERKLSVEDGVLLR
jgi:chaperone required for assembly of F1-ATPase